jgi:hypothetical protein
MIVKLNPLLVLLSGIFFPQTQSNTFDQVGSEIFSPLAGIDERARVDFGSAVSISDNGRILAVGAPNFDYEWSNLVDTNTAVPLPGAGAILIYQRLDDGDSWNLDQALFGTEDEGLGDYFSLSPDGVTLAVRHDDRSIQLYQTSTMEPIFKSPIQNCPGDNVEVFQNWLVVSCDRFDGNRGRVDVYEFDSDGGVWTLWADFVGDNTGDRFGFQISLDTSSEPTTLVLAISSPNAHTNRGMIRVVRISTSTPNLFSTVGKDIVGNSAIVDGQFGYSIAIRSSTLIVGAPTSAIAGANRGSVHVYDLDETSQWIQLDEILGKDDNDRFGRALALSADGNRMAITSLHHERFTGLVQVYQWDTKINTYRLIETILGNATIDWWGNDVSMNAGGSVIVSGSMRKRNDDRDIVGSVRVFQDTTPFCGLPVSDSVDPFLDRRVCRHSNESDISKEECNAVLGFVSGKYSPCVWRDRVVDLEQSSESPTISPTEAVQPSAANVDASRSPNVERGNFETEFLQGCPCDVDSKCINDPLEMGDVLGLCITSSTARLLGVSNLNLGQGSSNTVVIDDAGTRVTGTSAFCSGMSCQVRTPVDSTFFMSGRPDSLLASGTIVIAFDGRNLRGGRDLETSGDFFVPIALSRLGEAMNSDDDFSLSAGFWVLIVALVILIVGCSYVAVYRKGQPALKARGAKLTRDKHTCVKRVGGRKTQQETDDLSF